jgi:hypothetical protein
MERHRMTVSRMVALAVGMVLLVPSTASAASLYASPGGTAMDDCTDSSAPCSIDRAVNTVASSGDDVTLLGSGFAVTNILGGSTSNSGAFNLRIHGAPGARPVLNLTGAGEIILDQNSVLRDVVVESNVASGGAVVVKAGTIERVSVHEAGSDATACLVSAGTVIRDSVCWYNGTGGGNSSALRAFSDLAPGGTATIRNVTAVSTSSYGLYVIASGNFGPGQEATIDVTATNLIAKGGGPSGQEDVRTALSLGATRATATLDHSNYASESETTSGDITTPGTATNTIAPPVFVNAGTGDFHQAMGSIGTRDLGTATGLLASERDFDAQYRSQGANPDIGADEFPVAPPQPIISSTDPVSGSNENTPLVIGSAEPFSLVTLYPNGTCIGASAGAELAAEFATPGIGVNVPDNSTTTFSATATNDGGTSTCSDSNISYTEVTPSTAQPPAPATQAPVVVPKKKCKKKKHRAAATKKCKKRK